MAHALGENGRGGARSSNGDGGALRARSEGERAREKELTGANGSGGGDGRSWWPTRARPGRRMRATRRPSSAGTQRRHGAAIRARGRGRWCGEGVTRWWARPLRPAGQKRGRGLLAPPFPFFRFF